MIPRTEYLNQLISFKDKNLIKIVTGIRRCGKSTLFELYIEYLKNNGIDESQIIKVNLEDPELDFRDYMELYHYIKERLNPDKKNYVFIDEVQNVEKFQKAVDGLYIQKNVDLYITGSNAYLLSGELATLLSGRYVEIKMLPFSFKEYMSAFDEKNDLQDKLLNYLKCGSFPQTLELLQENPGMVNTYLDGLFSTIVYKDIMIRNNINDKLILESVVKYILDNIGSAITTKKISDTLTSMNRATSNHTVENYITAFLECFLIYKVERFDVKGKMHLASGYKYYAVDMGIRNYLLGKRAGQDMGHILENIVYLELLRRGYKVYVGKVEDMEIDFVAENEKGLSYYQVALTVREEETLKRELKSLQKTGDHYPKYLLTMDRDLETDYEGITKINIIDWLLEKE
ncbi:MAG: ATP-binding protein [Clostridia bacterium]|nr:ATP-binding protein [Clostridia bacterium]